MKKPQVVILMIVSLLLVACHQTDKKPKSTANELLPANEQKFTWWHERDKPFGSFEYQQLAKDEAEKLMLDKFKLEIPATYPSAQQVVQKNLATDRARKQAVNYTLYSTENELKLSEIETFSEGSDALLSYSEINFIYQYIPIQKNVKLESQSIIIHINTANNQYNDSSTKQLIESLANWLELDDQEIILKKFEEATKDPQQLKHKEVPVFRNFDEAKTKRLFGKGLTVKYNGEGVLSEVYAVAKDYRM